MPYVTTSDGVERFAIPGARLIEYDGAPHGLPATHGKELVRDLIAFLAR